MYAATTKGEGNAADERFSAACQEVTGYGHYVNRQVLL